MTYFKNYRITNHVNGVLLNVTVSRTEKDTATSVNVVFGGSNTYKYFYGTNSNHEAHEWAKNLVSSYALEGADCVLAVL